MKKFKELKKGVDVSFLFKLLLMFFLSVLVVKISISLLNLIFGLFEKVNEVKILKKLGDETNYLLKKEPNSILKNKFHLSKEIEYVCFTRPKNLSEELGYNWDYNNIKNKIPSFYYDEEIKKISENNQKNVFFIYKNGVYKGFLIKGLYSSFSEENPLCFKDGENYYLKNYRNIVIISKNLPQ